EHKQPIATSSRCSTLLLKPTSGARPRKNSSHGASIRPRLCRFCGTQDCRHHFRTVLMSRSNCRAIAFFDSPRATRARTAPHVVSSINSTSAAPSGAAVSFSDLSSASISPPCGGGKISAQHGGNLGVELTSTNTARLDEHATRNLPDDTGGRAPAEQGRGGRALRHQGRLAPKWIAPRACRRISGRFFPRKP